MKFTSNVASETPRKATAFIDSDGDLVFRNPDDNTSTIWFARSRRFDKHYGGSVEGTFDKLLELETGVQAVFYEGDSLTITFT